MSSFSSLRSIPEQNEQQQQQQMITTPTTNESSVQSQQLMDSSILSPSTPVLLSEARTQREHENGLIDSIDDIIRNFLSGFNAQQPNRILLRWTGHASPKLMYSIVLSMNRPEDL